MQASYIKLTYEEANDPIFMDGLRRIMNTPLPSELCYRFKKILDEVHALKKRMHKEYEDEVIQKFVAKDANGKLVVDADNEAFKLDEAKKEEFQKASEDFYKRTSVIERERVPLSVLMQKNVTLTPQELKGLDPVLVDDLEKKDKKEKHLSKVAL